MPRSAAQQSARRLRRQLRPTFPLARLPPELQLLVLGKCDPTSVRRLLQLSPCLRSLYLRYPESCLQQILHQIPRPTANLLRASWALHRLRDADFDTAEALALLNQPSLVESTSQDSRILADDDDPLDAIEVLLDMYEEVEIGAVVFAQSMNAAMETFINPWVQIMPISLSPTEHARIANALWMLKIYYQLQLKFSYHHQAQDFVRAFITRLPPWQAAQIASVEWSLRVGPPLFLHRIVEERYGSAEYLAENSAYVRNYYQFIEQVRTSEYANGPLLRFIHSNSYLPTWPIAPPPVASWNQASHQPDASANQRHNPGWHYYQSASLNWTITPYHYRHMFLDLGMFFWDHDRLVEWGFDDPRDYALLQEQFDRRVEQAMQMFSGGSPGRFSSERIPEQGKADLVIRWTRCPVQCTFEEWSYQGTALHHYATGQPPLAEHLFDPYKTCGLCGEAEHLGMHCNTDLPCPDHGKSFW